MRYGKSISLLLISLTLTLTALVLVMPLPVGAQGPTETPVIWPTNTPGGPTATLTSTPSPTVTPTVGPPGGPGWKGVEWVHAPTSAYAPGCPAWSEIQVDTSRLDWRWLSACRECAPGSFYDPFSTPMPTVRYSTPLPSGLYLSTDSDLSVRPGFDVLAWPGEWRDQVFSFPALDFDVVGVYFNVVAWDRIGTCQLKVRGDRVGSPIVDEVTLQPGAYCFGPAAACAQYAPGARRPSDHFRVVNAGVPVLISTRAGGAGCSAAVWDLMSIQFLGIQYYATPTPTPSSTPQSPYALTCPARLLTVSGGTSEYLDTFSWGDGARYPWGYPDHSTVYGVVFRPAVPHPEHIVFPDPRSHVGGVSVLAGALRASALVDGELYCAGDYQVCRAVTGGEQFHWFDLPSPISLTEDVLEFGLRVVPVMPQVEVKVDLQFIVGAPGPECGGVPSEPTVTPMPTTTPLPSSWVRWATSPNVGCASGVTCTRLSDYVLRIAWDAPAGSWVSVHPSPDLDGVAHAMDMLYVPISTEFPHRQWNGSTCVTSPSDYWWWGNILGLPSFLRESYAAEAVSVNGVLSLRRKFKDMYGAEVLDMPYEARSCPALDAPARRFEWYVVIEAVNGVQTLWQEAFGAPPTPTPTPTPPPVVRTPTPGPAEFSGQCEWVALREPVDPPMVWPDVVHMDLDPPACWTMIPRFGVDLPDLLGLSDFEFPAVGLCFDLYAVTPIKFLGITIDPAWFVLPLLAAVGVRLLYL